MSEPKKKGAAAAPDSPLPPLYQRWVSELVGAQSFPRERHATCDNCAMLDPGGDPHKTGYYHPQVKCCTYHPTLFNFLVGRILDDPTTLARAVVEQRVAEGAEVTPLGVNAPPQYALLYRNASPSFGRALSLRCPYYIEEGGKCGVWRHRQSVCATWYCKHERAEVSFRFWRSMHRLLSHVEKELALSCMVELAPGREAFETVMPLLKGGSAGPTLAAEDLDRRRDPALHRRRWGRWAGREHEYYRRCAKIVDRLSWKDVAARTGAEVRIASALLVAAHADLLDESVPERLGPGKAELVQIRSGRARMIGYSGLDPIELPARVLDLLPRFDGKRSTDEVLAEMDAAGTVVDPMLVRRLVDFGILKPTAP